MSHSHLLKALKAHIYNLETLPDILRTAKKQDSFNSMLTSIQHAMRDQISQALGLKFSQIDRCCPRKFQVKIDILGQNLEILMSQIGSRAPR